MMFIFYGVTRFGLEYVRDDNPIEFTGFTVSQNISIGVVTLGLIMLIGFTQYNRVKLKKNQTEQHHDEHHHEQG